MEETEKNYKMMEEFSLNQGASLFGVADISRYKKEISIYRDELLDNMDRAISLGYHLCDAVFESIIDRPNKLYYRHYKMANIYLDQLTLRVGEEIQRRGYNYIPIPASVVLDWEGLSSHACHRRIGNLAGLGWKGRSGLLINDKYGARVRYVSLLTDMPIRADKPVEGSCGSCRACVDSCPAGAIGMEDFNLDACHEMLKHFGKTLHVSLICGVCQRACRGNNPLWYKEK